jgi:hypothetical protein
LAKWVLTVTCSIRYYWPGRREDAGLLIIANEKEFPAYKARLEASGYVVLDNLATPPAEIAVGTSV